MTDVLLGRTEAHLAPLPADASADGRPALVHRDSLGPFLGLRDLARREGFDLAVVSGFRGLAGQKALWNAKASGARPVLDGGGRPLDPAALDDEGLLFAILRWSAFPGASRHHWGSDVDVIDRAALPPGGRAGLLPSEVAPGGVFGPLHEWLDGLVAQGRSLGFYRPYDLDRGGVAPERWHLSHAPVARGLEGAYDLPLFEALLAGPDARDVLLLPAARARSGDVFRRFVANVAAAPSVE